MTNTEQVRRRRRKYLRLRGLRRVKIFGGSGGGGSGGAPSQNLWLWLYTTI